MPAVERQVKPKKDTEQCFRQEYRDYVAGLPSEIQEMFMYVPIDSLVEHAQFDAMQNHPALHDQYHVLGVLEFAFRYMAYSTEENDPLEFRADLAWWEEMTGKTYTIEEVILAFAVGLTEHDKCEIATGYSDGMNGPILDFRSDGYRGRRKIEGYPVPEKLSAEIAEDRINSLAMLSPEQKMRIGALAHHVAMETTWTPTDNPFSALVRAADRNSGWFNTNMDKDCGIMCELVVADPTILVNPRVEYNFHQLQGSAVLPVGIEMSEVAEIIFTSEGSIPDHIFDVENEYSDRSIPVRLALQGLQEEALISLPHEFFAQVIADRAELLVS